MNQGVVGIDEEFRLGADTSISISAKRHETLKTGEQQETTEKSNTGPNLENFGIPKSGLPDAQNPEPSIKVTEAIEPAKKGLWESFTNRRKRN